MSDTSTVWLLKTIDGDQAINPAHVVSIAKVDSGSGYIRSVIYLTDERELWAEAPFERLVADWSRKLRELVELAR